ncbi:MAG: hypothetical protein ACREGC_04000, partial [Minisyncoccia bacterium]
MLFGPALLAWQFLLTYEVALRSRPALGDQHAALRNTIENILAHDQSKRPWLLLAKQYLSTSDGLQSILPEHAEIFIANKLPIFPTNVSDFFVLVQLERIFTNSLALQKVITSPYMDYKWGHLLDAASLKFLVSFNVKPHDWQRLKKLSYGGDRILSDLAIEHFNEKFSNYNAAFDSEELRVDDARFANGLIQWIPFRRLDEEQISHRVWGSREKALSAFAAVKVSGFRELWERAITHEGLNTAKKCNLVIPSSVVLERAFKSIPASKVAEFADIADESFDRIKSSERPMIGWRSAIKDSDTPVTKGVQMRSPKTEAPRTPHK